MRCVCQDVCHATWITHSAGVWPDACIETIIFVKMSRGDVFGLRIKSNMYIQIQIQVPVYS